MINCSIHNYKEWMEAYLNGNLNREDMFTVEAFLQKNPHILDQYLSELEELSLVPEEISFTPKSSLNISIDPTLNIHKDNFSEYFISHQEGILNKDQTKELNLFLSNNPKLEKEFQLYGLVILFPDTSIKFPDKNALLKRIRPVVPLFWSISAAASILIIVGLWLFWPGGASDNGVAMGSFNEIKFIGSYNGNKFVVEEFHKDIQTDNTIDKKKQVNNTIALNKKSSRDQSMPVQLKNNHTVELNVATNNQLTLQPIPHTETNDPMIASAEMPKKKGLLNKIFSGEQVYIEDYVNATFGAFKNNKEDDDKWVLKVDRDNKGKSKKVKFTSPIFSFKTKN
jgi:hypothetical protein